MTLPTAREYTAVAGVSPVTANLLNNLQDCIVGMKKPSTTKTQLPALMLAGSWAGNAGGYLLAGGTTAGITSLPTENGDRVTAVAISSFGTGALTVTHVVAYQTPALTVVSLGTFTDVNRAAAWGTYSMAITAHIMGVGEALYHSIQSSAINARVANQQLVYDRL